MVFYKVCIGGIAGVLCIFMRYSIGTSIGHPTGHYRRYSLTYCIGYRVLNNVYIYIYTYIYIRYTGVFYEVLPMVLYNKIAINSLRYIKVVFCKVFYGLFSYISVFLYLFNRPQFHG